MAQAYRSIFRAGLFEGKVAVVTGGGTGIGLQIATELLELSGTVVICSRSETKLAAAAEQLKPLAAQHGGRIEYLPCNIRQEDDVERTFTRVVEMCGGLDILVNNGGGQFPAPAATMSAKGWRAVIDTNLNGTFLCCQAAHAAWMAESEVQSIAFIFSSAPRNPSHVYPGYAESAPPWYWPAFKQNFDLSVFSARHAKEHRTTT